MHHRHIHPSGLSLAAIDDIIDRGGLADWAALFERVRSDGAIAEGVRRVASHGAEHGEAAERYSSWLAILRHSEAPRQPEAI